jgi:hypothetical protein
VNDIKVTPENVNDLWEKYFRMNTTDPELKIVGIRGTSEISLSGPIYTGYVELKHDIGQSKAWQESKPETWLFPGLQ